MNKMILTILVAAVNRSQAERQHGRNGRDSSGNGTPSVRKCAGWPQTFLRHENGGHGLIRI